MQFHKQDIFDAESLYFFVCIGCRIDDSILQLQPANYKQNQKKKINHMHEQLFILWKERLTPQ